MIVEYTLGTQEEQSGRPIGGNDHNLKWPYMYVLVVRMSQ